jgi:hypothetical protein
MRDRPALFLGLLADQPALIAEVGVLRWRAAGSVGTPGPWIESTARTAGRDRLPLSLVAMDLDGRVIGAVTLGVAGWVVDLVVQPGERLCGIGRLMVGAVEDLAHEFYRHCGWDDIDEPGDDHTTVLSKALSA